MHRQERRSCDCRHVRPRHGSGPGDGHDDEDGFDDQHDGDSNCVIDDDDHDQEDNRHEEEVSFAMEFEKAPLYSGAFFVLFDLHAAFST
jgi:hypothetical protein